MSKWFVYRVHLGGQCIYVGKGCGIRYLVSARRLGGIAGIVRYFDRESQALSFEKKLIAELSPPMNKTGGGEGRSCRRRVLNRVIERRWLHEAVDRAIQTRSYVDVLIAAAFLRSEFLPQEQGDVASAAA